MLLVVHLGDPELEPRSDHPTLVGELTGPFGRVDLPFDGHGGDTPRTLGRRRAEMGGPLCGVVSAWLRTVISGDWSWDISNGWPRSH